MVIKFKISAAIIREILKHSWVDYYVISIIVALGVLFCNWNAQVQARVINLRDLHNLSVSQSIPSRYIKESIQTAKPGDTIVCDSLVIKEAFDLNLAQIDTVGCNLNFQGTEFRSDVKCEGVHFLGNLNFSQATFHGLANFSGTVIEGQANFDDAKYEGMANFTGAKFLSSAIFKNATFKVSGHFDRAEFQSWAGFSGADFKAANFSGTQFLKGGGFNETEFHETGDFIGASANGEINFRKSKFHQEARFWGVAFHRGVSFAEVEFINDVAFLNSELQGDIQFDGTQFKRKVTFQGVTFNGKTSFRQTLFGREAIFKNSEFASLAQFIHIDVNIGIDFTGVRFHNKMTIDESRFYGDVIFMDAVFEGDTIIGGECFALFNFKNALSTKRLNLQKLSFSREGGAPVTGIILEQAYFASLKTHWNQLKDWLLFYPKNPETSEASVVSEEMAANETVASVYTTLQDQYRKSGQQSDFEACYYDFRELERLTNYKDGDWAIYGLNTFLWLSSGYCMKLNRLMSFGLFVIILFAFLFSQEEAIDNRARRNTSITWFGLYFLEGISLSLQAFTHIRYNHYQPSDHHLKLGQISVPVLKFHRLVLLEGIIGWIFFALLLLTFMKP